MLEQLKHRIRAAQKQIPADWVLKNGKVVNVFSGSIQENDIAICGEYIVGVGPEYQGLQETDIRGQWVIPGLIDAHMHIESSMLLPSNLAKVLLPHGTTTVVADPHEIANVSGLAGISLMMQNSRGLPFDFYFMAPSCVPATSLETSGACLDAAALARLAGEPGILGLAEMMNYPGVLTGTEEVIAKLLLFKDHIIDGHSPLLRGPELQAYLTAGIRSDHETRDYQEGLEKLNSGMWIMIREGTNAKNLSALLPLVRPETAHRFCLVSDDLHPLSLLQEGHLDFMVRKAIQEGLDPVTAIRLASFNPAQYFGLKDRGAIAPGLRADLAILRNLEQMEVTEVIKNGRLAAADGRLLEFPDSDLLKVSTPTPLKIAPFTPESFSIPAKGKRAKVIELIPDQIITRMIIEEIRIENNLVIGDIQRDILKLVVLERHHATGRIGLGLVKGFGLKQGAVASSIAHDSHNVIAVGVDDLSLYLAVKTVQEMGGGIVVANQTRILAELPLEVAGLMTRSTLPELVKELRKIEEQIFVLGSRLYNPFMHLSFLALPVIPELKLTDKGLVDVIQFQIISLFPDE